MKAAGTYLERILARTAVDLQARKKLKPPVLMRTLANAAPKPPPFEQTVRRAPPVRIIGELKRRALAGFIDRNLDLTETARQLARGGAAALSVVTDGPFFGGSVEDLSRARPGSKLPLLRRDFVIDEYQLADSRANGASAVVLIAAALEGTQLAEMMRAARDVELEAVVEVHDATELDRALDAGAGMVIIDHRDLRTQAVDLSVSQQLAPIALKSGALTISSGGVGPEEVRRLLAWGVQACIVGEHLLRAADREQAMRALTAAPGR